MERGNFWQSSENSLYFKANDDKANFDNRGNLANANDNYSGGLLFLGLCLNKGASLQEAPLPTAEHPADFLDMSLQD